ncbi:TMEM43 family protein [Patescibacteria group bacterium]|nr:TMEM43 family protein [Patescibacteria group bacterium]
MSEPTRRLVGSANPIARFGRDFKKSIGGIFVGGIMIIIALVLTYSFANQIKHSKTIDALPLQQASEALGKNEMVKIAGSPNYTNTLVVPDSSIDALFYETKVEEYAMKEISKTKTIVEDGKEYEETYYEYKPDWTTVSNSTKWSDFSVGGISIKPESAKLQCNTEEFSETIVENPEYENYRYMDDEDKVGIVQKTRTTYEGVRANSDLIIVGYLENDVIASGEDGTFFISNKTSEQLSTDQKQAEKTSFWLMAFGAWLLMSLGFTMFFGPITKVLNIIPGLGSLVGGVLFAIFAVLSAIIILVAYIGLKFWWLILLLLVAGAVGLYMYKKSKTKNVTA